MKIYLIGFMGCGKTYWGKLWAEENGLDFYDLDELIAAKEQRKVTEIFETNGEDYFREVETAALRSTTVYNDCIVACGGGTACVAGNMKWINENGLSIYLYASAEELREKILSDNSNDRPLLKGLKAEALLSFIKNKLEERKAYYEQSKIQLRAGTLNGFIFKKIISSSH